MNSGVVLGKWIAEKVFNFVGVLLQWVTVVMMLKKIIVVDIILRPKEAMSSRTTRDTVEPLWAQMQIRRNSWSDFLPTREILLRELLLAEIGRSNEFNMIENLSFNVIVILQITLNKDLIFMELKLTISRINRLTARLKRFFLFVDQKHHASRVEPM